MIIGQRLIEREDGVFEAEDPPDEAQAMDLFRADPTCDMCRAAQLAEKGVMASSVPPKQLHSQCRAPGGCQCDCEYAQGGKCINCGRTMIAGTVDIGPRGAECVNRYRCSEAILAARTGAPAQPKPAKTSPGRRSTARPCACGCGGMTKGGEYLLGHRIKSGNGRKGAE